MPAKIEEQLALLLEKWNGEKVKKIEPLPAHGSERKYYRLHTAGKSFIGAHNNDKSENLAFLSFSRHFFKSGLPVPEIYAEDLANGIYLEQDLGNTTLFDFLTTERTGEDFSKKIISTYEQVIQFLPKFQITAGLSIDYNRCYPRHSFDKQSMMWDLNYFKYYFLKLAKIPFDEQKLEDDFQNFTDFLLSTGRDYFLYRDFQSRNVMLVKGAPYFIDYQGGRKGALQYDIASLLYDAKADIPQDVRNYLLEKYIDTLKKYIPLDRSAFISYYTGYVLIRIMQALGAYGFRGFYERKEHFLKSVPYAVKNLEYLLNTMDLPLPLPALTDAWSKLVRSTALRQLGDVKLRLKVRIQSFSYKRGIPWDEKGHGGGFVMDCRSLPNPGKLPEFSHVNGNNPEVIAYLEDKKEVKSFLKHTYQIIDQVVKNYRQRNFTDLLVAFGCTGGQHRSVYCANQLTDHLKSKFDLDVEVRHLELENK